MLGETVMISETKSISRTDISYFISVMDAFIIFFYLFMIFTLKLVQNSAARHSLKQTYSASLYSLQISNLPSGVIVEELTVKLWNLMNEKLGDAKECVLDVQIAPPENFVENAHLINFIIKKKNEAIKKFLSLYAPPDYQVKKVSSKELQNLLVNLQQDNSKTKKAEKLLKKIQEMTEKKKKLKEENKKLMTDPNVSLKEAFITFNTMQARDKIFELYHPSKHIQGDIKNSASKVKVYPMTSEEGNLVANPVDEPTSIIWENLGQESSKVFKRRVVSFLITLSLWLASAIIIIALTFYKNSVNNKYPSINCKNENPTRDEAGGDYNLGIYQQGLIVCYCSKNLSKRLHDVFPTAGNRELCSIWFKDKISGQAVTWGIVLIVIIINIIMQIVIQLLSKFEKHVSSNEKLAHRVVKIFLGQFFNTGMIILLVSIRSSISWWQGNYGDINPTWYSEVGSTILSTMLINAISTPTTKIAGFIIKKALQFIDRKFGKDESITRKKRQADYENLYTLPEFVIDVRYGQVLYYFSTLLYIKS